MFFQVLLFQSLNQVDQLSTFDFQLIYCSAACQIKIDPYPGETEGGFFCITHIIDFCNLSRWIEFHHSTLLTPEVTTRYSPIRYQLPHMLLAVKLGKLTPGEILQLVPEPLTMFSITVFNLLVQTLQ